MTDRESVARKTIDRLRSFSEKLEAAGGDIDKTDLRVTRWVECTACFGEDEFCEVCGGEGMFRVTTKGGEPA